jgi:hypothetical protein
MVQASLARLRDLASALPRPSWPWESRPTFEAPAPPEAVAAFERAAGFPLPADLRDFLGTTGSVVALSVHNGYWLGGVERLTAWPQSAALPSSVAGERLAPVATDGGGNGFLISAAGKVWRWDHETGRLSVVATSFAEFLERVA